MKKGVEKKPIQKGNLLNIFYIISFILILTSLIFAQTTNPCDNLTGAEKAYCEQGQKFKETFEQGKIPSESLQETMIDNFDDFYKGFKTNPENFETLFENFYSTHAEGDLQGEHLIVEDLRNKFLQKFLEEGDNENIKKLIQAGGDNYRKKNPSFFGDSTESRIKYVDIQGKNIKFVGNKLARVDEEGNPISWIDFDNMPRWTDSVSYYEGEREVTIGGKKEIVNDAFFIRIDTGSALKTLIAEKGSFGNIAEAIAPDGRTIGLDLGRDIQSITLEAGVSPADAKVSIKWKDLDGKLHEEKLGKAQIGEESFAFLEGLSGNAKDVIQEMMSDLDGIGPKMGEDLNEALGTNTGNRISFSYGGDYDSEETIIMDFDEQGDMIIKGSEGATIISTDSAGNVNAEFNPLKEGQTGHSEGPGQFIFDKYGDVKKYSNAEISIYEANQHTASLRTKGNELEDVTIIRNTFVDAVMRGDYNRLVREVGYDVEDLIDESMSNYLPSEIKARIAEKIKKYLDDPNLGPEMKKALIKSYDSVLSTLQEQSSSIANDFLTRYSNTNQEVIEDLKRHFVNQMTDKAQSIGREVIGEILQDPQQVRDILEGDSSILTRIQKDINAGDYVEGVVGSDIYQEIKNTLEEFQRAGIIDSTGSISTTTTARNTAISQITDSLVQDISGNYQTITTSSSASISQGDIDIDSLFSEYLVGANAPLEVAFAGYLEQVQKGDVSFQVLDKNGNPLTSKETAKRAMGIFEDAQKYITEQKNEFKEKLIADFAKNKRTGQVLDVQAKEFYVNGGNGGIFNANTGFRKISVNNQDKDSFQIFSNGEEVARVQGKNTYFSRIVDSHQYVPIEEIVNENSGHQLKLASSSDPLTRGDYSIYDVNRLATKTARIQAYVREDDGFLGRRWGRGLGPRGAWQHPIVGTTITAPEGSDIGADPNSKIEIYDLTDQMSGILGGRIKGMVRDMIVPVGWPMGLAAGFALPGAESRTGGNDQLKSNINDFLQTMRDNNLDIPPQMQDIASVIQNPEAMTTILRFVSDESTLKGGNSVTITPGYLAVNGKQVNTFTTSNGQQEDLGPALRTFMRSYKKMTDSPALDPFRSYGGLKSLRNIAQQAQYVSQKAQQQGIASLTDSEVATLRNMYMGFQRVSTRSTYRYN
ncbi:hypothetical protein HOE04_00485 [archaeon]|jgi:hypothetical protein|nr:hypothetical protein [archaeon]